MSAVGRQALTAHAAAEDIVAHRAGRPVSRNRFLADVAHLAERLPAGSSLLNVCQDRYRFTVGLAAGLVAGKTSLLPTTHTPETVRQLRAFAADLFCLHDGNGGEIDLPRIEYLETVEPSSAPAAILPVPQIDGAQVAAVLFTSGSTGLPVAQAKTWGALVRSGAAEARRLALGGRNYAIVATVPAQHSYGFESSVLLALHGGCAAWSGRPFYPADIAAALAAVPCPRLLVTTPFHLRALLDSGVALPPVDLVLSATAPLSAELAREAETRLAAPLQEIYGCTEAGQLASRRTAQSALWQLFPGVRLEPADGATIASGGHVEGRVPLSDVIELQDEEGFLLHGRHADMVNIAGKRSSLSYLNHQLLAVAGVEDGCFLAPDEAGADGIARLCAFAVAPGRTVRELLDALRQRIDPVFLPRPLLLVDRLPRNATGKLPRGELLALLARHQGGRR